MSSADETRETIQRAEGANMQDQLTHTPRITDDPEPPDSNATSAERKEYLEDLETYANSVLAVIREDTTVGAQQLWEDFTTMFCATGISSLTKPSLIKWRNTLKSRGVYVKSGQGIPIKTALIECMNQTEFKPMPSTSEDATMQEADSGEPERSSATEAVQDSGQRQVRFRSLPSISKRAEDSHGNSDVPKNVFPIHEKPDNPSDLFSDAVYTGNRKGNEHLAPSLREVTIDCDPSDHSEARVAQTGHTLGLSGMSKLCQSRRKYSGGFDEDLVGTIQIYRALAKTCQLTEDDLALGLPMILDGDAMTFFSENLAGETSFQKIVSALEKEFTSEEQRNRLLRIWQKTSLRDTMRNNADKSEVVAFREVCRLLSTTQRQLHKSYHDDRFLRDQIVLSADIPEIERSLREKAATTSHEAIQRIAALLSSEPRSAGAHFAHDEDDHAMYGLGQRYGGDARKKPSWRFKNKNKPRKYQRPKGCIVYQKDHFARNNHSQDEIRSAIQKLRNEKPRMAFTVEEIVDSLALLGSDDHEEVSDDEFEEDSANITCTEVSRVNSRLEISLANHTFCYGRMDKITRKAMKEVDDALRCEPEEDFKGIVIDTGANRSSLMSLKQYQIYCEIFGTVACINKSRARKRKEYQGDRQ